MSAVTPERLAGYDTGTLAESGAAAFAPGLRPLWACGRLVGRALPVSCPAGQNLMLHRAVAGAQPGEVVVARCGGAEHGYWGEVLAAAAQARGVLGLVIDGSVRDAEAIRELGFAVFCAGVALPGTGKRSEGSVGDQIEIRAATVSRGDIVVADESGVVVIAASSLADVAARAQARSDGERALLASLRAGRTTLELLGLPD